MKQPKTKTSTNDPWSTYKSRHLAGDLVMTIHGPGIIEEAGNCKEGNYSIEPLPGTKSVWVSSWHPPKHAWYENKEVTLIKKGLLSQLRDAKNSLETMGLNSHEELEAMRQKLVLENPEDDDN